MRRLFIRPGAIGDCLCWLPVLQAIGPKDAEVWAPGAVLPLFAIAPVRRNLESTGFSLLGIPGLPPPPRTIEALRGFDEILSWSGWNQPELRKACERLALPITFFRSLPDASEELPISDWYFRQARAWHGLDGEPQPWRRPGARRFLLPFRPPVRKIAVPSSHAASPMIVLHPFSGSPAKNWSLAHYRSLAAAIVQAWPAVEIRWCASPHDSLPADLAPQAWRFESLADLAIALDSASLFIGNDSGVTHLAAMLGIPCAVFFGPMNQAVWAPRGATVEVISDPRPGRSAAEIPYLDGEKAVLGMLNKIAGNCKKNS